MMSDAQILQLAKTCGFGVYVNDDGTPSDYFDCYSEQLLKFARAIYDKGWDDRHSATQFAISFDEHLGY